MLVHKLHLFQTTKEGCDTFVDETAKRVIGVVKILRHNSHLQVDIIALLNYCIIALLHYCIIASLHYCIIAFALLHSSQRRMSEMRIWLIDAGRRVSNPMRAPSQV